jgi:hypothetical protein
MALMQHGVIQLKDQHLGQLLYPKSKTELSYTPTDNSISTAQNCAVVAGGREREIQALTAALLQPSTQHT